MNIIEVENIKKSYNKFEAVKGISFCVEAGKLFSFLGPNGAGKSTTIDILCTLLKQDSGNVVIDGHLLGKEDDEIRSKIGVVFQDSVLDSLLTVRENLTIRGNFYNLKGKFLKEAVENAAKISDAVEFLDRPYGKLSGGQRRRADIARALINTPKILFLDEPTTGLDPKTKNSVWQTILNLQKNTGMSVFLTTHYMEEAEKSDYITIINNGKIAVEGTPYELKENYSSDSLKIKANDREKVLSTLKNLKILCEEKNELIVANLNNSKEAIPILKLVEDEIDSFEVIKGSMDDVFLRVIGGNIC